MFSVLAALIGFFSSMIPKFIDAWDRQSQRAHELRLEQMKIEMLKVEGDISLEKQRIIKELQHIKSAYENEDQFKDLPMWMNIIRASVRPVITYLLFGFFLLVKGSMLFQLLANDVLTVDAVKIIFDDETKLLLIAVLTFWFGNGVVYKK
jgi:hypothetical protein